MTISIRKIRSLELHQYSDHLLRLSTEDRYLRFGYAITDEAIIRYVATQYRIKQIVIGAYTTNNQLVAAIELVFDTSKYVLTNEIAEIGLSVEDGYRGNGLGSDLFQRAIVIARNRQVSKLISHCLTRNKWMMRIAKKHGMTVVSDYGESQASIDLPPADAITVMGEVLGDGMALWDYAKMPVNSLFNPGFTQIMAAHVE
jgi:RimJ/RimL family protein N-acetyltransferase